MARLAREENEALKARSRRWKPSSAVVGVGSGGRRDDDDARVVPSAELAAAAISGEKSPHFLVISAPLGLKTRHVRGPRTPGGLPQDATRAALRPLILENKDLRQWRPSRN